MSRDYVLQPFRESITLQIDYVRELNQQQHAAATATPGPALVIAGAGSGKTRTLIYRVAYLLEQGIPPERILLLTFTNKAAGEMMRRVSELLGQELADLWGGTFHSIGHRILRQQARLVGFGPGFTVLDREDARHLISACITELKIDTRALHFPRAEVLGDIFSFAANTGEALPTILDRDYEHLTSLTELLESTRQRYAVRKQTDNAMDYDDLLTLWLKLLMEHEDVREHFQRRFQFILVDEYQDTNRLQGDLIDLLAERHRNVMAVGDDAQSIYAWRGANYQNIFKFPQRYPGAKLYKIETNYRSTPEILQVANAAIAANRQQFPKQLAPSRKSGSRPVLVTCQDASEQAAFVAQRAIQLRDEGINLNRMAVLYRSHFHALELQLELTRRQIPYTVTSGIRFFEQAHIKDVSAYLKLAMNPRDELSFKRLVQLLPGIGAKGAEKLWKKLIAAYDATTELNLTVALRACADGVPAKARDTWPQFIETLSQLQADNVRDNPSEMIRLAVEAGYEDYLKESYPNYRSRKEDLDQLSSFAQQFHGAGEFLTEMALLTDPDADDGVQRNVDDERLRLSTIHPAKGLEFDVVFVIMLCEGLFPSSRALETPEAEEEERRLLYVAITRARNELYLSYPLFRSAAGGEGVQRPSRFLSEIPRELLEEWNLRAYG